MSRPRKYPRCVMPGCQDAGSYARGFCQIHYGRFRNNCRRNGSWRGHRDYAQYLLTNTEVKPFEYEGDEDALIALAEQQEHEKQDLDSPKGE